MTGLESALAGQNVQIVGRDDEGRWLMVKDPDGNDVVFER